MHRTDYRRALRGPALLVALTLVSVAAAALVRATPARAQAAPRIGIVCTTGEGTSPIFNLTTKTGHISLPDANTAFMWGYSSGFDGFQHPGPVLCVNEGDTVTVILHNTLPEASSINFPGQESVMANGMPAQPQFNGGGTMTSLIDTAAANGGPSPTPSSPPTPAPTCTNPARTPRSRCGWDCSGP